MCKNEIVSLFLVTFPGIIMLDFFLTSNDYSYIAGLMHSCASLDSLQGINRDLGSKFTRHCGSLGRRKGTSCLSMYRLQTYVKVLEMCIGNPHL